MERRRIYLMRHGETLYQRVANEGAIGNGALTERGREQIATAALLFRAVGSTASTPARCRVPTKRPGSLPTRRAWRSAWSLTWRRSHRARS